MVGGSHVMIPINIYYLKTKTLSYYMAESRKMEFSLANIRDTIGILNVNACILLKMPHGRLVQQSHLLNTKYQMITCLF